MLTDNSSYEHKKRFNNFCSFSFLSTGFYLRELTLNDAAVFWQVIYDNREFLHTCLPLVDGLNEGADEELFLEA